LDRSFSDDGRVLTDFADGSEGGGDRVDDVAIQADGKILAAGTTYAPGATTTDFALARYNPDGTLDLTFSDDGKVITDFLEASDDDARAVAIQPDGKILVVGWTREAPSSQEDFALARYNPDGTPDDTFSGDGKVTTDFFSLEDMGDAVAIQPDERIVAGGLASQGINEYFALARYETDGQLDQSFGREGNITTDFGAPVSVFSDIALQIDRKIVAAGRGSPRGTASDMALARYNPDGTLDRTFRPRGIAGQDPVAGGNTSASARLPLAVPAIGWRDRRLDPLDDPANGRIGA
jgi:uncharacterized delta-60 repeat protein